MECLIHPFFWSASKRLAFLCDASDREWTSPADSQGQLTTGFEIMEPDAFEEALVMLEAGAVNVVGKDWYSRLDKTVTSNLGKYRKYKGNSVRDLLRAMRNKVSGMFIVSALAAADRRNTTTRTWSRM